MLSTKEKTELYDELMNIVGNSQLPIDTRQLVHVAYLNLKKKSTKLISTTSATCWRLLKQPAPTQLGYWDQGIPLSVKIYNLSITKTLRFDNNQSCQT